jgi:hypothetical protein
MFAESLKQPFNNFSEGYTVSRAAAIYHPIDGSGAKKSVNFVDVG